MKRLPLLITFLALPLLLVSHSAPVGPRLTSVPYFLLEREAQASSWFFVKSGAATFSSNTAWGTFNASTSTNLDFGVVPSFHQDLHTTAHSWNVWVKVGTVGGSEMGIFGNYDATNIIGYALLVDSRISWFVAAAPGHRINVNVSGAFNPGADVPHMVTITQDNSGTAAGSKIYLDSVLQSGSVSEDALNGTTVSTTDFKIGGAGTIPLPFNGDIDFFTDYPSYVLTQTDINALYHSGNPTTLDPRTLSSASQMDAFVPIGEGSDSSGVVHDLKGGHNATNNNVPFAPTRSVKFVAASTQYIDLGNNYRYQSGDSFSIDAWACPSSFTGSTPMIIGNSDGNAGYFLFMTSGGNVQFEWFANSSGSNGFFNVRSTASYGTAGACHHILLTYPGTNTASDIKMYIDGALDSSTVLSNTAMSVTIPYTTSTKIGQSGNGGTPWDGYIARVAMFNAALNSTQDTTLWNGGHPALSISSVSNLTDWFGMGNGPSDSSSTIFNLKGTINGTMTNGPQIKYMSP